MRKVLEVGKIYRLRFPGVAARVLEYSPQKIPSYPYLIESLILRSRWWADANGKPNNYKSPEIITAKVSTHGG